jgi:myo-inositol 2-dehydrogenase / D-chiro-inositol 1-dehydrogenase
MVQHNIRYGFIGCGMMGQEHLRNLAMVTGAVVTAIFEPDSVMRNLAAQFAPKAEFTHTFEALLARADIDAWVMTSPNHCHAEQLAAILAINPKPVLLEKPVCVNILEVNALQAIWNKACSSIDLDALPPIWTAMEYRYMPPIAKLIEEAHRAPAQSDTGEAVMFSIREHRYPFLTKVGDWNRFSRDTGGTLVEKCCHFFDLMRHVMQADPIRVYASGGQNHNHLDEAYAGETPDILDNAYVVLDFPSGRRAMLDLCMFAEGSRYQEELCVVGVRGKLDCKVPGPGRFWPLELGDAPVAQLTFSQRHKTGVDGWTNNPSITAVPLKTLDLHVDAALLAVGDHNGSTYYQHQKFFDMVCRLKAGDTTAKPEVSLLDGLKAVLIGLAAEESAKTGVAISLVDGAYTLVTL